MRYVARALFGISGLILIGSIPLAIQFWDIYGAPDTIAEWWNESWWVFAAAAVPAIAGYLVLRIARDKSEEADLKGEGRK